MAVLTACKQALTESGMSPFHLHVLVTMAVRSWELLPILRWFQILGPHQAFRVSKNEDLLWLTPVRSRQPVREKAWPGTRVPPSAPHHASAPLCLSVLLPQTGVLSYQSPEGIWVAQPPTAFSARATQGPRAGVSARCPSSCPPPQSEQEDKAGDLRPCSTRAMGRQSS